MYRTILPFTIQMQTNIASRRDAVASATVSLMYSRVEMRAKDADLCPLVRRHVREGCIHLSTDGSDRTRKQGYTFAFCV